MENVEKSNTGPQILIVDDVEANLMILENIILQMGHTPRCASSANEAAKLIAEQLPQLILLDVFMPEMDGYEFCEKLAIELPVKNSNSELQVPPPYTDVYAFPLIT